MSSKTTLQYGDGTLNLEKSDTLVGIKPRRATSPRPEGARLAAAPSPAGTVTLGGFRLLDVADAAAPMEETLDALRADPQIQAGTHVYHTSEDRVPFVPTGQLYVEFKPGAITEECENLLDKNFLQVLEARGERQFIVQITPQSQNPIKTAAQLQASPLVAVAEPDLATPAVTRAFVIPTDSRLADQWHLQNVGFHHGTKLGFKAGADARVVEAWEKSQSLGSTDIIVAVIDDGFDLRHPDLSAPGKIVAPRDFSRNNTNPVPDLEHAAPDSGDWHGTACAGVAVGVANGVGIVGAAPNCRLMPIRWGPNLSDSQVEAWFDHARTNGAWVVSCSWGAAAAVFRLSTRQRSAISRCAKEGRGGLGTVICFAAGNSARDVNNPPKSLDGFATHPDVIAVAASNSRDKRSDYSNFGKEISICAPSSGAGGWGITTTDVLGTYTYGGQTLEAGYSPGPYTDEFGGTSSACPLVAGICALLLSVKPDMTAAAVRDVLEQTARKIGKASAYDAKGHSKQFGHGCVNTLAAVEALQAETVIAPLWGKQGHETTNRLAIAAVPEPLRAFYEKHEAYIQQHAMDADHAKQGDPKEGPRHYIDIDTYGAPPFAELPEDYDAAVAKFSEDVLIGRGILPWYLETTYKRLVAAFMENNQDAVLRHSAWLGHYVGDAHVPLHTTANHDGQLTGQKGIHSHFEAKALKQYITPDEIHPEAGKHLTGSGARQVHELAFEWIRESHGYLQAILDADAATGGKKNRRNLPKFAAMVKPIVIDRLTRGCSRVAALWYSAWVDAGKPALSGLESAPHGHVIHRDKRKKKRPAAAATVARGRG